MKVTFTVPGIPVGKGRPRFMKDGHTYTPQKTRDYEDKVVQCWKCQSGKGFADGIPLRATVTAFFTVPKSMSKKKAAAMDGTPHIKRPDADNVAKAILDALNGHANNPFYCATRFDLVFFLVRQCRFQDFTGKMACSRRSGDAAHAVGDQFTTEPHTDKRGVRGLLVHMLQWFADAGEHPWAMAANRLHYLKNAQRLFAERHRV